MFSHSTHKMFLCFEVIFVMSYPLKSPAYFEKTDWIHIVALPQLPDFSVRFFPQTASGESVWGKMLHKSLDANRGNKIWSNQNFSSLKVFDLPFFYDVASLFHFCMYFVYKSVTFLKFTEKFLRRIPQTASGEKAH